jgi:hypothetical protein
MRLLLLPALTACGTPTATDDASADDNPFGDDGDLADDDDDDDDGEIRPSSYFPDDGDRRSTYAAPSDADWRLVMEKEGIGTEGQRHTVTWSFTRDNDGARLGAVTLSTQGDAAVLMYGYEDGDGNVRTFDPPIGVSDDDDAMREGDAVFTRTTDSDGTDWNVTVTLSSILADCPTTFNNDFKSCPVFTFESDATPPPFWEGAWAMVATYGPARLALTGPPPELEAWWSLSDFDYDP